LLAGLLMRIAFFTLNLRAAFFLSKCAASAGRRGASSYIAAHERRRHRALPILTWIPAEPISLARIIAIANQKGGVGKTTTAVNLAAALAIAEQRTLLVDGDPQGNASSGLGISAAPQSGTVYEVLLGQRTADQVIQRNVLFPHLDVMPATPDLAGAEVELVDADRRELAMRDALDPLRPRYDAILIDCPPSLGLLTLNMLSAADSVLIPLQCEYFALEGITHLTKTIELVRKSINPSLVIEGVLLTMYDARLNLSRQVAADTRAFFGDQVFETVIPRNVRLAEAPSFGKPIQIYDIGSVGSVAYLQLAKEVIAHLQTYVPGLHPSASPPPFSTVATTDPSPAP
jgi:chromosome partitioning protein